MSKKVTERKMSKILILFKDGYEFKDIALKTKTPLGQVRKEISEATRDDPTLYEIRKIGMVREK